MLLTSELVTNAVVHAGTELEVHCALTGGEVRVEVSDRHRARPVEPPDDRLSGRGLLFPEALANSWGITYGRSDKRVWFMLPAPAERTAGEPEVGSGESTASEVGSERPATDDSTTAPFEPEGESSVGPGRSTLDDPTAVVRAARPTVDELAQRTAHTAQDALSADSVYVLLAEGDAELVVKATAGVRVGAIPATLGLAGAPTGGRGVYRELGGSPYNLPALRAAGVRSLVTAPFVVDDRVIGLLIAASPDPDRFGEADIDRLQRIADAQASSMERAGLVELERARRGWLGYLAEASSMLAGTLDQQMTMALVAQLIVPRIAVWCAVFTVDESGVAVPGHVWHADETMVADLRTLLEAAPTAPPVTEPGPWHGLTMPVEGEVPKTAHRVAGDVAYAFPLLARGRCIGMLVIGGPRGARFSRETLEPAEDLAGRAALAIDNARLYAEQADMSRTLQRSLLPPELPELPGLDLAVVYDPAGEHSEVGGDFYDVFGIGDGRRRFAIGDVCGTGLEAATVTGLARQTLRILGREGYPIPDVLERLNRLILDEGSRARFLTLVHGEITTWPDGHAELVLAVAGHPLPLVLRPDATVTEVGESQLLLGVFPEAAFTTQTIVLPPGHVFLAFTDGVTERRSGDRLLGDDQGLEKVFAGCVGLGAGAVAARIQRTVQEFSAEASQDDMAVVVLRVP